MNGSRDGGRKTEDRERRIENGGRKTEDGGLRIEKENKKIQLNPAGVTYL
jgi:hypothetical protein